MDTEQITPWRNTFDQINNPEWKHYTETQDIWTQIQHNPCITLTKKDHTSLVHGKGPTLAVHGWGSSQDALRFYRRINNNTCIPGDVISFNFPDASRWIAHTIWCGMPFSKSSFAGDPDIVTLLSVLKTLCLLDSLPEVIYPHSRGAATALKAMAILNKPHETDKPLLETVHISDEMRLKIVNACKVFYVLNPIGRFDHAFQQQVQTKLALLYCIAPSWVDNIIAPWFKQQLPRITQYNPNKYKDPLDYVKQLKKIPADIWLHFEKNDEDVSNKDDCSFVQELLEVIPTTNLYISCTDNGGHNAYGTLINNIIHNMNKRAGVSYLCDEKYHTEEISTMINDAHIQAVYNDNCVTALTTSPSQHLDYFSKKYSVEKKYMHQNIIFSIIVAVILMSTFTSMS
jgi:hypothetical protein